MRLRNSRLRTKITAPLSLTALWAFAAWVTLREGVKLARSGSLKTAISQAVSRFNALGGVPMMDVVRSAVAEVEDYTASSVQLGLYVVGRPAERYGVRVSLKHSPYGGTTAVVLIPRGIIVEGGAPDPDGEEIPATVGALPVRDTEPSAAPPMAALPPVPPPAPSAPPAPEPVTAAEPAPAPQEETGMPTTTPSGLPMRVPQASLAEPLKADPLKADPPKAETTDDEPAEETDPGRSPDETRRIVGAFQSGTRRGRAAAETQATESEGHE